jgi:hypothetical protein
MEKHKHTKYFFNVENDKEMRNTNKTQILVLIVCLLTVPMFADDVPADFGDVLGDNPADAPISNFYWFGMLIVLTVLYLFKKKYFKKA